MCMSEVTEWDTPLQRHQWKSREMSTGLLKPSSGQPPPLRHTFWRLYPFRVSQPALFSSHPIPSASAPLFFCAVRDLCRRDAGTERWRMGKASELGGAGVLKSSWNTHTDSSGWSFFLVAAADSSASLSLSTALAFFSNSEKSCLLTFWAPRPPFLAANYKETQRLWGYKHALPEETHECKGSYRFLGSGRFLLEQGRKFWRDPR